ncbi:MAG: hypothetical protein B0D96_08995 [Candidatus Sedimenticola endophacoides]|uniref:Flagellar biosynthesis protein FlgB n=1 Tax=Candidatus Sedimenticola endophacoides TaxID=2548426 RepID=A0A6N4E6R1_9GAMM|nr:MAG: hypothetical protein B0D94_09780 [Candidatus Sedimenticola endophacoides]OQX34565.1 MAG: hypothetical protein B0D96_08995 [Candidatus Sedimenticola endophacoides]OQX41870.1 MAG: hypothetical protein B0D89_02790 [Candidatus Sedimenticola endophacoides]PUD98077.1 MAG: hypothetical protein C3L26_13800 [Candidatus Sedimenticola endophacoides]PUE00475.1 MAG: hypothetical protein C3L25_13720 [Candidatus Sedimenticola endophacoides]
MQFPRARLLIFAKAPAPGRVKTRLAPLLGADGAADLYHRLLLDTFEKFARKPLCPVNCWCSPDTRHPVFAEARRRFGVGLYRQRGADLGERMAEAAEQALRVADAAVLIGADCPGLGPEQLRDVLDRLKRGASAVVIPAEDGGYVLLGLSRFSARLFQGIAWGEDGVMAATRERLAALGWRWEELAPLWDLDRPADLERYRRGTG